MPPQTPTLGLSIRQDRSALSGLPGNKTAEQWLSTQSSSIFPRNNASSSSASDPVECSGLATYKNVIELKGRSIEWEQYTNDSRLTASGAIDNGWRMASWSPSGLSGNGLGTCILATLDVNREVVIYTPGIDPIKAGWSPVSPVLVQCFCRLSLLIHTGIQVFRLTQAYLSDLLEQFPDLANAAGFDVTPLQRQQKEAIVMEAQATCVSWSPATPSHAIKDESLLAVGSRSGIVGFWR